MTYYIKEELKRVLFSKTAVLTFLITLICMIIGFFGVASIGYKLNLSLCNRYDSADIFLLARSFSRSSILILIAPLLAVLVFSNSYLQDKDTGFLRFIYVRMSKKKYILSRIFINAISSGIIMVVASVVMISFLSLLLGIKVNPNSEFKATGSFSFLYAESKWIYVIYIIIMSFIFNAIFATLSLGLSPFINNKYLSFLCPFFIYILSGTLLPYIGLNSLNMTSLFRSTGMQVEIQLLIYQLILLIVGGVLFYLGVLYRNEKDL